jgi:hypothetical protein
VLGNNNELLNKNYCNALDNKEQSPQLTQNWLKIQGNVWVLVLKLLLLAS